MPEDRLGDGGRKTRERWAPAVRRLGACGRSVAAVVRVLRDALDVARFIDRHL